MGLKALHDVQILHRDLKSANVFCNRDGSAKLGDMNVSKIAKKGGLLYTQTGTPYYASPEVKFFPIEIQKFRSGENSLTMSRATSGPRGA